jgi:hypothetical protein
VPNNPVERTVEIETLPVKLYINSGGHYR